MLKGLDLESNQDKYDERRFKPSKFSVEKAVRESKKADELKQKRDMETWKKL